MNAHTSGPWIVTGGDRIKYIESSIGGGMMQEIALCLNVEHGDMNENARRIVACVNLMEGYDTADIEGKTLHKFVSDQAFINGMSVRNGLHVELNGLACQFLAASFAGQFKGSGAVNYLEVAMSHPEVGEFVVTMQRMDGKTPVQFRKEAEAQRDKLLALAKQMPGWIAGEWAHDMQKLVVEIESEL